MTIRTALWSDDSGDEVLHLIHEDDWDQVPDGTILHTINGDERIKGEEHINLESRYGYLAVGFRGETILVSSKIVTTGIETFRKFSKIVHVNE